MTMSGITGSALRLWLEGEHKLVLDETLIDLEVEETLDTPARCRARFVNVGTGPGGHTVFLYCNRGLLDFGKEFRVEIVHWTYRDQHFRGGNPRPGDGLPARFPARVLNPG